MNRFFDITEFGAAENQLCTAAIQSAFDAADAANGTVVIPSGTFLTGTINMRGASLYLQKGAVLKGSPDIADYPPIDYIHNETHETRCLLYSIENHHMHISGEGTIDMNGDAFFCFDKREIPENYPALTPEQLAECATTFGPRPTQPIFFLRCRHITMEGITLLNSSFWTLSFNDCEDLRLQNLTIDTNRVCPNNDGMHFCGCRRVFVHGCSISSGDDCIALSGITDWDIPCENITISDCILTCSAKAIVVGYMHSIVRNVLISNCILRDTHRGLCIMASTKTGLVEHILVQNLRVDTRVRPGTWWGNGEPICIFAKFHRNDIYLKEPHDRSFPVNIRDVQIQNVSCHGENVVGIVGENGSVQDISIDGLTFERKPAKNVVLKGRGVVSVQPNQSYVAAPENAWLLVEGCKNVQIRNARGVDENGNPLVQCHRN